MRLIWSLILAPFLFTSTLFAQDRPVVIELFTSQGCSSCPPADAFLHELAARDDVVALALHVDYWDYIGWKDIFADPSHTKRQRAYAKAAGKRMIYTPQMVINGQDHVVGNRPKDVEKILRRHRSTPRQVEVSLSRRGNRVKVVANALSNIDTPLVVQVARYKPKSTVDITHGENGGRTLSYSNVVTDWSEVARWDTRDPLSIETRAPGDQPVVVILQRPDHGPIEGVAILR